VNLKTFDFFSVLLAFSYATVVVPILLKTVGLRLGSGFCIVESMMFGV
jgi:hypothetical protein